VTALYIGFFSRLGLPRKLHSDRGSNFEFKLVCTRKKVKNRDSKLAVNEKL